MILSTFSGTVISLPAGSFEGSAVSAAAASVSAAHAAAASVFSVCFGLASQHIAAAAIIIADNATTDHFFFIKSPFCPCQGIKNHPTGNKRSRRMAVLQNHKSTFSLIPKKRCASMQAGIWLGALAPHSSGTVKDSHLVPCWSSPEACAPSGRTCMAKLYHTDSPRSMQV